MLTVEQLTMDYNLRKIYNIFISIQAFEIKLKVKITLKKDQASIFFYMSM